MMVNMLLIQKMDTPELHIKKIQVANTGYKIVRDKNCSG